VKRWLIALVFVTFSLPCLAQNADDPASRDDILLLLQTMHSHDLLQRTMEVQTQSMRQLFHDMLMKDAGKVPPDFDARFNKAMANLIKGMPMDEIMQAMIPAYQKHFTHGDIAAMNTFYSSPVGQKVLQELPGVMQDGMRAATPILIKYITDGQERMKHDLEPAEKSSPTKPGDDTSQP
jgi:uncharacterized protein